MSVSVSSIVREFERADLGDRRLNRRLVEIVSSVGLAPEKSFPRALPTTAALRGMYRFVNNESVTPEGIIEPHHAQTVARARDVGLVIAVHDTTQLEFDGEDQREGLGFIRSRNDQGFSLHCALLVAADGSRRPLGVIGHRTWVRTERKPKRRRGAETFKDSKRESLRWSEQVAEVENRLGSVPVIHVADREADAFPHLQDLTNHERRFVVRMRQDRVVVDENGDRDGHASDHIARAPWKLDLEVPLTRRAGRSIPVANKPPRNERLASLEVTATRLRLKAPVYIPAGQRDPLELNVVHAVETNTPDGEPSISWVLLTSEPIDTAEHVRFVLETYRTRWLIEEFFKALKTGCEIQKRQLESYEALINALAIFLPIAWQLLLLRNLHRTEPKAPASLVLTPTQIQVLRAKLPKLVPAAPTLEHALRAIASLAGHNIKKPPGWQTLGIGLERLLSYEEGWLLARNSLQSCV